MAIYSGSRAVARRARRPARLPHPDHDRRPALGHRHRRHGPPRAAQRARDVGPGGRGRRRRRPPCCSTRPAPSPTATGRPATSCPWTAPTREDLLRAATSRRWPTRRPRAARSSTSPWPRASTRPPDRSPSCAGRRRRSCPFTATDPHDRRRPARRHARSARAPARPSPRGSSHGAARRPATCTTPSTAIARPAAPRSSWRSPSRARRARMLGVDPPQGHRQARHARALRRAAARWASAP